MHRHRAIVIGAGMSGLLAARALSGAFDRVLVIERDRFAEDGSDPRKGVPQGRHVHGLLFAGYEAMRQLLPGLEEDVLDAGALSGDVVGDVGWFLHGGYKVRFDSGLRGIVLSRPALEGVIRQRVGTLPNVEILDGHFVKGLITTADGRRVTGISVATASGSNDENLQGDIVVDAAGRGSRMPEWLDSLGYDAPEEEKIEIDVSYTTRIYRRKPEDLDGSLGLLILPTPPDERRGCGILAIEGGRWMVTLTGLLGERAPTEEAGFLAYLKSLPTTDAFELICRAEPLSGFAAYRFRCDLRRRYERLKRFPAGLLVLGDALCSFNPIYGQGMSVAALEAVLLRDLLREDTYAYNGGALHRSFFERTAKILDTPWSLAAGADLSYRGVGGARPIGTDVISWYIGKMHKASTRDREVCRTFFEVANLLKSPAALFRPATMLRIAATNLPALRRSL